MIQQLLSHSRTGLLVALCALAAGCGPGGTVNEGGGGGGGRKGGSNIGLRDLEVVNTTNVEGTGVAEVVVPLGVGDYKEVPHVKTADGDTCQAFAMGPRFDDGSIRYLRLEVPLAVKAMERRTLALSESGASLPAFQRHASIPARMGVDARFQVQGTQFPFPDATLIESGPNTEVWRSRVRSTNSMLWAELTVFVYSKLDHAKFTLQWGNSDPTNRELMEDPGEVQFVVKGARVEYEHTPKALWRRDDPGSHVSTLHWKNGGKLGDGQSQLVEGRFLFGSAKTPPRLFGISTGWVAAGTFGPFGVLLEDIAVDTDDFVNLIASDDHKQKDHPWARCVHGCNPDPSNTGYQPDFGTIRMRADVLLADPRRLPTILRSVYQEACRPTHFRETDVSRVLAKNHPGLLTLDGRPKLSETKDFLGKKKDWLTSSMKGPSGERWRGHDTEHLSINFLAGMALLTGNRFAREECEHHCMLYLTGFTYKNGTYTDATGPARMVGRSSLAAIWMWLVTGREDVKKRCMDRAAQVLENIGKHNAKWNFNLDVCAPRGTFWVPWEEGMALTGLAAVDHNWGSEPSRKVIERVAKTIVINGLGKKDGSWRCGYELPWKLSNGADYEPRLDPNFKSIAAGNGLTTWCIPAVFLAAEYHPNEVVRKTALTIIQERHGRPVDGLSDTLLWMCVSRKATGLAGMTSAQ